MLKELVYIFLYKIKIRHMFIFDWEWDRVKDKRGKRFDG